MESSEQIAIINSLALIRHQDNIAGLASAVDHIYNRVKELDKRLERLEALLAKEPAEGGYR